MIARVMLDLSVEQVNQILFAVQSHTQALINDITRQAQAQAPQPIAPASQVDPVSGSQPE